MADRATTIEEQIRILTSRGVEIVNEDKAKECLFDIGYFRLCSYLFPFEETYPSYRNRTHKVIQGTKLSDAVALYYFDFDMRIILIRYISRIEVALRTYITYSLSNKYCMSPTWFVNPAVMTKHYIDSFDVVYSTIKQKPIIKRHHNKYINDKYAPAWKTIEHMTFGNIELLYRNLKSIDDKLDICKHFGVNQTSVFESYLGTVRSLRNICAHGGVLFDLHLEKSIKRGPAGWFDRKDSSNLSSTLAVVDYFIGVISINRQKDMRDAISDARKKLLDKNKGLEIILKKTAGNLDFAK